MMSVATKSNGRTLSSCWALTSWWPPCWLRLPSPGKCISPLAAHGVLNQPHNFHHTTSSPTRYDFYTKKEYKGGSVETVQAALDVVPLFVREGSVIPMKENARRNTADTM